MCGAIVAKGRPVDIMVYIIDIIRHWLDSYNTDCTHISVVQSHTYSIQRLHTYVWCNRLERVCGGSVGRVKREREGLGREEL